MKRVIAVAGIISGLVACIDTAQADGAWVCSHGPVEAKEVRQQTRVKERDGSLLLYWGEVPTQPDVWQIAIANPAAVIATKAVAEWSRATHSTYPDRAAVERDIHPTGAALSVVTIDKKDGNFRLVMLETGGVLALQETGTCKADKS